ncbi:hypothetical protein GCM10027442_03970 [Emticicia fontis]
MVIAFFIAIIRFDWADDLFRNQINNTNIGQYVTVTNQPFSKPIVQWLPLLGRILLFVYCMGVIVLGFHLAIQFLSYLKLKRSVHLKEMYGLKVHVVAQDILPFSFGKSIFISESAFENPEIGKILLHESIHIQQNHSIDVLLAELVRIINWINPFAWLLKKSIHQNLEFLTDAVVISKGIDKKTYQYLLLHFSGNNPFSLVTNFNFYSLKTRISKMNQNQSNQWQYSRFLLFIPLILVLMFVFSCMKEQITDEASTHKKTDELKLSKLKLSLKEPVVEVDAANQIQSKKMDEVAVVALKEKLREPVVEMDSKSQNLSRKMDEIVIEEPKSKHRSGLELRPAAQDQPKKTLILQKMEKSSQAEEKLPPPPPPAMPEKQ